MSAIFTQRSVIANTGLTSRQVAGSTLEPWSETFTSWLRSYRRFRAFKAARAELMALDDRMLRDIGLDRSEITSALLDAMGKRNERVPIRDWPL
ncbi:MAG: DUF1127 domain-containing protein [Hyphomicrobiaceae bacterium]